VSWGSLVAINAETRTTPRRDPCDSWPLPPAAVSEHGETLTWNSLAVVNSEARLLAGQSRLGTQCPNDGVRLQAGREGLLHCPFDGWVGTPEQALTSPGTGVSVVVPVGPTDIYTSTYTTTYGNH
jgi:hypothetical protein